MHNIALTSGKQFQSQAGLSILDAAAKSGISLPYSCKTGRCSSCKCKLVQGEASLLQDETGLTVAEKQEGWILSCVRTASTDLTLEAEDLGNIQLPAVKTLPCRISEIDALTPSVARVTLRLPPTADFNYLAGQYIDVIGPNGMRRSYSLANANSASKTLELHIRAVDGGAMSGYWFNQAKQNDLLRLNGPLGTFFLRNTSGKDLIFLATGTGIAPVKAILESLRDCPASEQPKSIRVLWGNRTEEDFYIDIAELFSNVHYIPVVSRPAGRTNTNAFQIGYVQNALLASQTDFSQSMVYACGSDAMIQSAKEALIKAGLPSANFYSDAFVCSAAL